MLKHEQVPDEAWTQVALRLESLGCIVPDYTAKLVAAEAINAWPGMQTGSDDGGITLSGIYLPLSQEADDDHNN